MSKIIASAVIRGAHKIYERAEKSFEEALKKHGESKNVEFPNTGYFLPVIYAMTGMKVATIGEMKPVLERAKSLLPPVPSENTWLPYLGPALDAGMATLFADEIIEALKYLQDDIPYTMTPSPTDDNIWLGAAGDVIMRERGIEFVDGSAPGFAACVGAAPDNETAVKIARELQEKSIYVFMSGETNGKTMAEQLAEEGVQMGWETRLVPFGRDITATVFALGFASRAAMAFGGVTPGDYRRNLLYNKNRVFAFALALGEVDDEKYAQAAGAINYGFPVIADTDIPEILPTGICMYEHVVSNVPHDQMVDRATEVRGLKITVTKIDIPVAYGAAFEGERVRREDCYLEMGGGKTHAFEVLQTKKADEVEDGKIEVVGKEIDDMEFGSRLPLGIVVDITGARMQEDFEPILERQIHNFINGAEGILHMGSRDVNWVRISTTAKEKGFKLYHLGEIIRAKLLADYSAIVDKVQVSIYTEQAKVDELRAEARKIYNQRDERVAGMTDESVDIFYSCTLCVPEGEEIIFPDGSFKQVENVIADAVEEEDIKVLSLEKSSLKSKPIGELFINPGPASLKKITLSNGNSLTLTPNHKILKDTEEGLVWTKASELRLGDFLLSPTSTMLNGGNGEERFYLIDYLPDEIKVFDDEFLSALKELILNKYGTFARAVEELKVPYQRLYQAFYFKGDTSYKIKHPRFSLGEIKSIVFKLGLGWNEVKKKIRKFGVSQAQGVELQNIILDEEIMYAAGLVAADGCVVRRGNGTFVQFTNSEASLVEKFNRIMHSLFGRYPETVNQKAKTSFSDKIEITGKSDVSISHVHNPVIGQLMRGLGIGRDERRARKWTGEIVSSLSPKMVAAFIRGLFDGDGHITNSHIFITTRSSKEAQHILLLLKKLGISSYISRITRGYQVGTRNYRDFILFRSKISSSHPKKKTKMDEAKFSLDKNHVVRTDSVPKICGKMLSELLLREKGKIEVTNLSIDYKTIKAWIKGKSRASKEKLRLLLDDLKGKIGTSDPLYQELLRWSNSEVRFERVKCIEKVEYNKSAVYNFSVEDTHNYLVNGIVVKNCQSFAPNHLCIISPERLGLCGAYNWLDGKAAYEIDPNGPNQPVEKGETVDELRGQWSGVNDFVYEKSNHTLEKFNAYSMMEEPMTSCFVGDTEVVINDKLIEMGEFIEKHRGGEDYTKSTALTIAGGKVARDKIVAMQRFLAPKKLIKIRTKSGTKVVLTPNHKVAVDRPAGIRWLRADEIEARDRVISLKKLDLKSKMPEIIDLVPDDFRIEREGIVREVENKLMAKYGSKASVWRNLDLKPIDPRAKSIPLGTFRLMINNLGEDWNQIKELIRKVIRGASVISIPEIGYELFYLMGLIASDGSITKRGSYEYWIDFINTCEGLINTFRESYLRIFPERELGIRLRKDTSSLIKGREVKPTQRCFHCYTNNPLLGVLCEHYGIKVGSQGQWDLGRMVDLPSELISAFLAGLFDGDGSVRLRKYNDKWNTGEAYLCINDEKAAYHLQLLLKRLGIVGNIKENRSVCKVELYGSNLAEFCSLIRSNHPWKRKVLQRIKLLSTEGRINKTQEQVLPFAVGKALAAVPQSRDVLSSSTLSYYRTGKSRPVISNVQRVLNSASDTGTVKSMIDIDYFLDIITSVEEIQNNGEYDYVYNLTLANNHTYIVNGGPMVKNCGCFECIVALLPMCNGVMVVNRECAEMTPCGMKFSTLAGTVGGGVQTPGFIGVGKQYLTSNKFISADGGFKRIVWMPKDLKELMMDALKKRAEEISMPDFADKIADETVANTEEEVLEYMQKVGHPALEMEPMF